MIQPAAAPTAAVTCTLCGFTFNPADHPACSNCPLHSGCPTVCCPNCGATNINPQESALARLVSRLFKKKDDEHSLV